MEKKEQPIKIFATIHFKNDLRPDGYTVEDLRKINKNLNKKAK